MRTMGLICNQCKDSADVVTPFNGRTLLARTVRGETIVALHEKCEQAWADKNNCDTLVPLKRVRRPESSAITDSTLGQPQFR
jgi:hypothetical protein